MKTEFLLADSTVQATGLFPRPGPRGGGGGGIFTPVLEPHSANGKPLHVILQKERLVLPKGGREEGTCHVGYREQPASSFDTP